MQNVISKKLGRSTSHVLQEFPNLNISMSRLNPLKWKNYKGLCVTCINNNLFSTTHFLSNSIQAKMQYSILSFEVLM